MFNDTPAPLTMNARGGTEGYMYVSASALPSWILLVLKYTVYTLTMDARVGTEGYMYVSASGLPSWILVVLNLHTYYGCS